MNIDLLKINEDVKDLCKKQSESEKELKRQENFRKDLISIIQAIVAGDEKVNVHCDDVLDVIGLKARKLKVETPYGYFTPKLDYSYIYEIKLTKQNIKIIIDYINNTGFTC